MLFHSYVFVVVFLPIVLAVYFPLARRSNSRPALWWLVAASLVFYGLWDIRFLPLLLGSALVNFAIVWALTRAPEKARRRGALLVLGIMANLAVLAYFKYVNFFLENVNAVLGSQVGYLHLAFPVGISFFTFIQIGCIVDAYNGQVEGLSFSKYLLFATFFPYIMAGPLVQQREMFTQMDARSGRRVGATQLAVGLTLFAIGLAKKVIIADSIAPYADTMFDAAASGGELSAAIAWLGAVAYTLQLYFDFSGYTDMALAIGFMVGLKLPLNFNSPLKATSIIDFWRRWHITMTRFFTNYVYTPIAMVSMRRAVNRKYPAPRRLFSVVVVPVVITFTVAGLWHGPGWTFVIFGVIHGFALAVNHTWRQLRSAFSLPNLPAIPAWGLTMLVFVVSLVFFRADSVATANRVLASMIGLAGGSTEVNVGEFYGTAMLPGSVTVVPLLIWLAVAGGIAVLAPRNSQEILAGYDVALQSLERESAPSKVIGLWRPTITWALPVALLIIAAFAVMGQVSPFVYYKF